MGTAVPSESQEGNKYILTLIMKAIVSCFALAAFAAIAVRAPDPIEAQLPIEAGSDLSWPGPNPYFHAARVRREVYLANPYGYPHYGEYRPLYRAPAKRHALEQPYQYDNDYAAASTKHNTYSDEKVHEERLTKREGEAMRGYEDPDMYQYEKLQEERLTKREDLDTRVVQPNVC